MAEPDFGEWRLDSELQRYESTAEIDGRRIAVRVAAEAFEDKKRLGEVIGAVNGKSEHVLDYVVDDLLEDKNEAWLRDGESALSEQDFRRRLTLEAIEIGPTGEVELLVADDEMFWGHQIIVNLDSTYQIARVNLEG